jgi:Protein of unknown function (DUF3047)
MQPTQVADATASITQPDPWAQWKRFAFPGKRATEFVAQRLDGRDAMLATSDNAASMLRHKLRIEPADLGHVQFSWKVPALIDGADMAVREMDDSPVRVVLAFDGDRSTFSGRNYRMNEMMKLLTGEEMPYATLMYVWCNTCERGTVIHSPRTDRIRKIALEQGKQNLNQWLDYERDIRADYLKAYGEAPGALVGVALGTDTDNTHAQTKAWYGKLTLSGLEAR